jgi:two-component system phosphate regulon response regulator OmpR
MKPDADIDLIIVDDEREVRELLGEYFRDHGFGVQTAADAKQARELIERCTPKLAILDIHMPGEDGLSLARWLRERHPLAGIVFLTAAGDPVDRVVGLEIGADDYVCKPFDLRELLARVKSLMRRLTAAQAEAAKASDTSSPRRQVAFGECTLDLDERRLIGADGTDLAVTAAEFDLLALFARHPNLPLTRERIMEQAHQREWDVFDRSIDLRIMRLRRKIERNPDRPQVLKTVRNVGYVFVSSPAASR